MAFSVSHQSHTSIKRLTELMPRIEARARRLTGNADVAQDLAQDTAVRICAAVHAGRRIDDLPSYCMTTVRNLAASRWRSRVLTDEVDENTATTPPDAPARLALADLIAAIERLPDDQAALMHQILKGETSPAVLSEVLDVPQGTIMSRLARARARLRDDLNLPIINPISGLM